MLFSTRTFYYYRYFSSKTIIKVLQEIHQLNSVPCVVYVFKIQTKMFRLFRYTRNVICLGSLVIASQSINRIFYKIFIRHKLVISSDTLSRSGQRESCRCMRVGLGDCLPGDIWTGLLIRFLMLVSNEVCLCH